ncbi:hypothetical protein BP5796_04524 [Coleophoma crateriformis]|uniref:Zn(2)-C6 fungal-type domain-containing protein n=1 Tax=Coleophoma crateriformis TaxID=565419 RepID=A0A3D8S9T4_9HELO|nr:hypothetical protein BP5796_04524 [Coleophoma crateriformis]
MSTTATSRVRSGSGKSRSGCLTCKTRRIKCDEGKPSCLRCINTGRTCDGYRVPESKPSLRLLSSSLPGDTKERRALHFFITCTAPGLTGYLPSSGFWEQTVIQACISEPALRHTAVAIGSVHELLCTNNQENRHDVSLYSLQQYSKSIRHINRPSLKNPEAYKPELILLSCVLYVCFDSLRDQHEIAHYHLRAGLNIIAQWKKGRIKLSADTEHLVDHVLTPLFTQLGIQAGLFISPTNVDNIVPIWTYLYEMNGTKHINCTSMEEATRELDIIISKVMYIFSRPPTVEGPDRARQFSALLQRCKALETFLNSYNIATMSQKDLHAATLIKIYLLMLVILGRKRSFNYLAPVLDDIEPPELNNDFQTMINLIRSLISTTNPATPSSKSSFTSNIGVIVPLYITVVHSRNVALRYEALDLLKLAPRKEGMWDSSQVAQVCARVLAVEVERRQMEATENLQRHNEKLIQVKANLVSENMLSNEYSVELVFKSENYGEDDEQVHMRSEWLTISS